jgi:hypothetical protein
VTAISSPRATGLDNSAKPKAAGVTAGPPKAGLVSDSSGASMSKPTSKTKTLNTTTTTTTAPVATSGTR